jgi:hypothetical protein
MNNMFSISRTSFDKVQRLFDENKLQATFTQPNVHYNNSGCWAGCSGTCDYNCGGDCKNGCKQFCGGNCSGGCQSSCGSGFML